MKHASRMVRPNRFWSTSLVRFMTLAALVPFLSAFYSLADAQEKSPTVQRLLKKAQADVADVRRRVEAGKVPQDIIDELQKLDGLMQAGKHKDAEVLLDDALVALNIDPKTLTKKPTRRGTSAARRPLPKFNPAGFTKIFDGKTLDNWGGDPKYWKVKAGTLVGEVTPKTLLKQNSWIVWRGSVVEDFELVLDYRVSAQGNSGIGYRLAEVEGQRFAVRGPQADIHGGNMFTGICDAGGSFRISDRVLSQESQHGYGSLSQDCPDREHSYLSWRNWITVETLPGDIIHKPMSPAPYSSGGGVLSSWPEDTENELGLPANETPIASDIVVERTGASEVVICISGYGVRANYSVEVPRLARAFNQEPKLISGPNAIRAGVVGYIGGCPIFMAKWRLCYRVKVISPNNLSDILRGDLRGLTVSTRDDPGGVKLGGQ